MMTDQNNQTIQDLQDELDVLTRRAEKVQEEIGAINLAARENMENFGMGVDLSIAMFEQAFSELDQLEQDTDTALDDLIKKQDFDYEEDGEGE
ncbi:MAG: hypothetical protein ACYC8S_03165 [Minisyncoccota bacterium]